MSALSLDRDAFLVFMYYAIHLVHLFYSLNRVAAISLEQSHNQLQEPMQIPRSGSGSSTFSDTSLGSRDLQESTVSTVPALTVRSAVRERHGTPDGRYAALYWYNICWVHFVNFVVHKLRCTVFKFIAV